MGKEDERIIEAIKNNNDREALSMLYKRTLKKVQQLVRKNSGTGEQADDVFQDAVIVFFDAVKDNKLHHNTNVDAYIYAVSRNLWLKKLQAAKKTVNTDFALPNAGNVQDVSFFETLVEQEKMKALALVFGQLHERCKTLLTYIYYQKNSLSEVCEKMGYKSADVAKTNHYRCKKELLDLVSRNKEVHYLLKNI